MARLHQCEARRLVRMSESADPSPQACRLLLGAARRCPAPPSPARHCPATAFGLTRSVGSAEEVRRTHKHVDGDEREPCQPV
eukprot:232484-Chlamydomonas_euryale.AAC.6